MTTEIEFPTNLTGNGLRVPLDVILEIGILGIHVFDTCIWRVKSGSGEKQHGPDSSVVSHSKGLSLSCAAFLTKVSQWGFCSTEGLRGQLDGHTKTPACGLPASGATKERNWRGWVPAFKGSGQEAMSIISAHIAWAGTRHRVPPAARGLGHPWIPTPLP